MDNQKVLIVDDDVNITDILRRVLARPGRRVIVANDSREGYKTAVDEHPDLVILDVMMPGMSGRDVCWALRAEPSTRDTPIMMLSALNEPEDEVTGLQSGADTYASKPFDPGELSARVDGLLKARETARAPRLLAAR